VDLERANTILILINDDFLEKKLTKSLRSEGYHIDTAQDTKEALEKTKTERINLILIDEMFLIAHSSEASFVSKLKETYTEIPMVMMVTPETEKISLIHELLSNGNIEHCIFKPFLPQSLLSLVINIITKKQKILEREKAAAEETYPAVEKRKFIRNTAPLDISYYFIDKSQQPPAAIKQKATSIDICAAGIRMSIGMKTQIPKILDLELFLPTKESIQVTGQVMWAEENIPENKKTLGIHFVDMTPQNSQIISDYIMKK
jgi:CheY-like chemotaxis protein